MAAKLVDFELINEQSKQSISINEITNDDIAVIGISGIFPEASNVYEFWENLKNGTDSIRELPLSRKGDTDAFLLHKGYSRDEINYIEGGFLDQIDLFDNKSFGISKREAELTDPSQRLFYKAVLHCLDDAGYGGNQLSGKKTGIFLGYSNDFDEGKTYKQLIAEVSPESSALALTGNMRAMISARISFLMNFRGPNLTIDTTCSSSLVAVHTACQSIRSGECNTALAGGIELHLLPTVGDEESKLGIESSDYRTKTFDNSSDGTGNGEGVGVVLLKSLKSAAMDNDHIYCVVKGSAVNQDGSSMNLTSPNAAAQEEVITAAWKNAGTDPETITYVEAHGSGTKLGDPIEINGLVRAFRQFTEKKQFCGIGTVKTNIGHLGGAAGIASFIKMVKCISEKMLVPSLHFKRPNPKINFIGSPFYVNETLKYWDVENEEPRRCGISSFGLSGTNCHMILEEYAGKLVDDKNKSYILLPEIFVISSSTAEVLYLSVTKYLSFLQKEREIVLKDIAGTSQLGRTHHSYRIAMVVTSKDEILANLKTWLSEFDIFNNVENPIHYNYLISNQIIIKIEPKRAIEKIPGSIYDNVLNIKKKRIAKETYKDTYNQILEDVCKMFLSGHTIPWHLLVDPNYYKVSLPPAITDEKRCWIEVPEEKKMIHQLIWSLSERNNYKSDEISNNGKKKLIIQENEMAGKEIMESLMSCNCDLVTACFSTQFSDETKNVYYLRPCLEDIKMLIDSIDIENIDQIIFFASVNIPECEVDSINSRVRSGVISLVLFFKDLISRRLKSVVNVVILGNNVFEVEGNETCLKPFGALAYGFIKALEHEHPKFICRCIDYDNVTLVNKLVEEIDSNNIERIVAYRKNNRFIQKLDYYNTSVCKDIKKEIKKEGVYIITGGTGGIGLEIAWYFASKNAGSLVLISKNGIPDREQWEEVLSHNRDKQLIRKIKKIQKIEKLGATVEVITLDICNDKEVVSAFSKIRKNYGKINGVVHAAGLAGNGLIINKDIEQFEEVLKSKVLGTIVLDSATNEDELDFIFLFSSISTYIPAMGQSDYTSANMFLDAYAAYRNKKNKHTITINWAMWRETGMAVEFNVKEATYFHKLQTSEAIKYFERVLGTDKSNVIIGELNHKDIVQLEGSEQKFMSSRIIDDIRNQKPLFMAEKEVVDSQTPFETEIRDNQWYEQQMLEVWTSLLKVDELGKFDNFYDLGGNSILAVHLLRKLNERFPQIFDISDIYAYPTLHAMTEYLLSSVMKEEEADDIDSILDNLSEGRITLSEASKSISVRK